MKSNLGEYVEEIREAAANGVAQVDLARKYGAKRSAISALILGKTWKNKGGPIAKAGVAVRRGRAKDRRLSREQAKALRIDAAEGMSRADLCREYGIGKTTVTNIVYGLRYKDAGGPIRKRGVVRKRVKKPTNDDGGFDAGMERKFGWDILACERCGKTERILEGAALPRDWRVLGYSVAKGKRSKLTLACGQCHT